MRQYLCLFLLLCCACNKPASQPTPNPKETKLRLSFSTSPTTLDPRSSGDFTSSTLICLIYEGLMRCLPGGQVEPALAKKVEVSEDGKCYTFSLRNALWTDGHPICAKDFEASWKKIVAPSSSSLCAYLMFPIKNAELCAKGLLPISSLGVEAIDDLTLRVDLEHPTPYFLSLTAFPLFLPAPAHIDAVSQDNPVCNGPFRIKRISPQSEILLIKNETFWNAPEIALDAIDISIISDESTALQLFQKGEIDWLGAPLAPLPPDAIPTLQEEGKLQSIPMAASTFIAFNTNQAPFDNQHLREAFSLSLDREKVIQEIGLIGQSPAKRFLPPSLSDPLSPPLVTYDLDQARAHLILALEELKILPSDLESLTLYYKTGQNEKQLAQALQRTWKEALGITVQIEQLDPKVHIGKLHNKDYQFAIAIWIAQFHDPINILERYRLATNQKNFAGWESALYAELLEKASSTLDPQERLQIRPRPQRGLVRDDQHAPAAQGHEDLRHRAVERQRREHERTTGRVEPVEPDERIDEVDDRPVFDHHTLGAAG